MAVAHALVVAATISGGHISGGHLNPAVTLGLLFGGHITVVRSILYWIIQLLASTTACLLLKYLTGGLVRQLAGAIDLRDSTCIIYDHVVLKLDIFIYIY